MNLEQQFAEIACPARPEESWRRTEPELFFLEPAAARSYCGKTLAEITGPRPQTITMQAVLPTDADWIGTLHEAYEHLAVIDINGASARVSGQPTAALVITAADAPEIEGALPDSPICSAMANRLALTAPQQLEVRARASETPTCVVVRLMNAGNAPTASRVKVVAETGARVELVVLAEETSYAHHRLEIEVQRGAVVNQLLGVRGKPGTTPVHSDLTALERARDGVEPIPPRQLFERVVTMHDGGRLTDMQLLAPQGLARVISNIRVRGSEAVCRSGVAAMVSDGAWLDYEPLQLHFAPSSESHLRCKYLATGRARGIFQGLVVIHREGGGTQAFQENKNLLLSPESRIDATPRLQILPSNVVCKHGSATGAVSEKQLYYLMTRGLSREAALDLVVKAFVTEGLSTLPAEDPLYRVAEGWLSEELERSLAARPRSSAGVSPRK